MIYFDYNATTPMDQRVLEKVKPFFQDEFSNPSAVYRFGQHSRNAIEDARAYVAKLVCAKPEEIVFTSGGTEANNMALKGVAYTKPSRGTHIITSKTEHHSILHTCEYLESQGYQVTYLGVDKRGSIDVGELRDAIRPQTVLVSIMHANNETGTLQPLEQISSVCKEKGVYFHTDAIQTAGKVKLDAARAGVDLLSLSGHKFYGPKGAGALWIREGVKIVPLIHGGHQEKGRRAGTENVTAIVGLGEAARIAAQEMKDSSRRIVKLRDKLEKGILAKIKDVQVNGHPGNRLYNTTNISIAHVQADTLVINLDLKGVCVSSGSACASGNAEPSHVLRAMGQSHDAARRAIRFSLGKYTKASDIEEFLVIAPALVKRLRGLSSSC